MKGKAAALVFKHHAVTPRRELGQHRADLRKLRRHRAPCYTAVAIAPFEAVLSGDCTRERVDHSGKFIERPATHHGDGAAEPVGQLGQKVRQLRGHPHQTGCRSDLN